MKDYTDYYSYTWKQIDPPLTFPISLVQSIPLIMGLYVLANSIFDLIRLDESLTYQQEVINFYRYLTIAILLALTIILYKIRKKTEPHLTIFTISKSGLNINNRQIPIKKLPLQSIITTLESQIKSFKVPYILIFKKNIHIHDDDQRKKLIEALKHYQQI